METLRSLEDNFVKLSVSPYTYEMNVIKSSLFSLTLDLTGILLDLVKLVIWGVIVTASREQFR